jgi:hypothetical protein
MARRTFSTRAVFPDMPTWTPLEQVAALCRSDPDLPNVHAAEFMYMGAVANAGKRLTIHLYKHIRSRRYLNLDDAAHAYEYLGSDIASTDELSGGRYRPHRSIAAAVRHVEIWLFEHDSRPYDDLDFE